MNNIEARQSWNCIQINTVTIWIPELSRIQMVDLCQVVKWSSIQMVVWKLDWKKPFMVQNVCYLNGHVTLRQLVCVFVHFRPCEHMRKHAFAGRNTQQPYSMTNASRMLQILKYNKSCVTNRRWKTKQI